MSSSSAYNNVLLKSLVQTQGVAAPKRVLQDDYSNADFSQTFKDVNEKAARKIDKPAKAETGKKTTPVDQRKTGAGNTGRLAEERLAEERVDRKKIAGKKADDKIHSEKNIKESNPNEKLRAGTPDKIDAGVENKKLDDKTISLKDSKDVENSDEALVIAQVPALTIAEDNSPTPAAIAVGLPVPAVNSDVAPTTLDSKAEPMVGSVENVLSGENDMTAVVTPELAQESSPVESDREVISPIVLSDQSEMSDVEDAQLVAVEPSKVVDEKAPVEVAEVQATATSVLTAQTQATKSSASDSPLKEIPGVSEENSDVLLDAPDALVTDKTLTPSTKNTNVPDALAKTDVQQIDVTEDPKTVFEKMLQTVSKTVVREESAPANSQQNTTHSSPSLTDSFARFNDAQSPATRGFVVQTAVPVPVGQPQWSQAVGEKVLWLAAQNVSSAEINLHPKDLGPMQVKVSVNQEQTTVNFTSHHPMVREVLDQNLNRLRDMFSEQGLNLVNVDVSDKSFSHQQGEGKEQRGHSAANNINEEETVTAVSAIVQQRLVDHYA